MMLQALIAYADREDLGDPDFEAVAVRWLISLDRDGKLAGEPIPLKGTAGEKQLRPFTSPNELNQGTRSHFLCDTLERAVLFPDPKAADKAAARRVQHSYFRSLLEEAATATPVEASRLRSVLSFLQDEAAVAEIWEKLTAARAKPSDNATFSVDGNILPASEPLRQFWRERRRRFSASGSARELKICVATGELAETLDTTEKIRGVPGGLAMGTNLISFDKDAFCSFGLEQAQNAALSVRAELKIRASLNSLIEKSRGQGLVFNDTIHLHWMRHVEEHDPFDLLAKADPEAIEALIQSVKKGDPYIGPDPNAYYAMSLSGNGARIVVRDWLESTVPEIKRNIAGWFTDLAIVHPDGSGIKRDFKFGALLYGMVRSEPAELSPQLPTQLLHAALRGRHVPLPQTALAAALRRQQLDQENKLNPARLALIKACLLRPPPRSQTQTPIETMTESLNPESRDRAYLCGRLFAVFAELQGAALQNVNAGVVERYYASASVTPALVMGRLFRNAQFHIAKAEGEGGWKKGKAINAGRDFEVITRAIGEEFPPTLTLEEQGRFALGYYHQKADYRRRGAERKEEQSVAAANG
ncbi:MAG TPA: type I-C CRISPR-associated protein Cas8c/Csd1 [Chthoniobacterales bacterium]